MSFDQLLGELGAILDFFLENEAYLNKNSGGVKCVFLHNHIEANYVKDYLFTFLSIKYFCMRPLKKIKITHIFRLLLTLEITSV